MEQETRKEVCGRVYQAFERVLGQVLNSGEMQALLTEYQNKQVFFQVNASVDISIYWPPPEACSQADGAAEAPAEPEWVKQIGIRIDADMTGRNES